MSLHQAETLRRYGQRIAVFGMGDDQHAARTLVQTRIAQASHSLLGTNKVSITGRHSAGATQSCHDARLLAR